MTCSLISHFVKFTQIKPCTVTGMWAQELLQPGMQMRRLVNDLSNCLLADAVRICIMISWCLERRLFVNVNASVLNVLKNSCLWCMIIQE